MLPYLGKCRECNGRVKKWRTFICTECSSTHKRLVQEISSIQQTMEDKIEKLAQKQDQSHVWKENHDNLLKEEEKINKTFDKAVEVLMERKNELLRQLKKTAQMQKLVIDGQLSSYCRDELGMRNKQNLEKLKDFLSVPDFDQTLSSLSTGVQFQYNMSEVSQFGQMVFGDVQPAIQSTVPDVNPEVVHPKPVVLPVRPKFVTRATQTTRRSFLFDTTQPPKVSPDYLFRPIKEEELDVEAIELDAVDDEYDLEDVIQQALKALGPSDPQEPEKILRNMQLPLTAEKLAEFSPHDRKQIIGGFMFGTIYDKYPEEAVKITELLLKYDNAELLVMLEEPGRLIFMADLAFQFFEQCEASEAAKDYDARQRQEDYYYDIV